MFFATQKSMNQAVLYKPKFHIPGSTWEPPQRNQKVELYINRTNQIFEKIFNQIRSTSFHFPRNTTASERLFLKQLSLDPTVILKPTDKNLGLAILDTSWYNGEITRQLSDTATYKEVQPDEIHEVTQEVQNDIEHLITTKRSLFSEQVRKFLTVKTDTSSIQVPRIYILPKVHKPKLTGRPIVPSHSWCTTALSRWLDDELQSLLPHLTTVTKDSKSLVNTLENLTINHPNCILITADVQSLYTEIPTSDGLKLMKSFLQMTMSDSQKRMLFLRALELILTKNYTEFNGKFFHQIKGTAMGTPCAPVYANIFLFMLEGPTLKKLQETPLIYKRFLDDILSIVKDSSLVQEFVQSLNDMHPNIKLDFSINAERAEFLDLVIYKGKRFREKGILDLKVHQKVMNMYLYIPYSSYHTSHMKSGFITTELIRYIRNTSSFEEYMKTKRAFYTRLRARGYPVNFLNFHFNKVKYKDRENFLGIRPVQTQGNSTPLIFSTTFTPLSKIAPIKQAIKTHWNLLKTDKLIAPLFSELPHMAWKKGTSLQQLIIKNKPKDPAA